MSARRHVVSQRDYLRAIALAFNVAPDGSPEEVLLERALGAASARLGADPGAAAMALYRELGTVQLEGDVLDDGSVVELPPAPPRMTYAQALDAIEAIATERGDSVSFAVEAGIAPATEVTQTKTVGGATETESFSLPPRRRFNLDLWSSLDKKHYASRYDAGGPPTYEDAVRCYRERCTWPELERRDREERATADRAALIAGGPELSGGAA